MPRMRLHDGLWVDGNVSRLTEASARKDQAGGRAVGEQSPAGIRDPPFGGADPPAAVQYDPLRSYWACFWRNGPYEGNLELESDLRNALVERGLDGQSHAAVEQRGREAAMDSAGRIEMGRSGNRG